MILIRNIYKHKYECDFFVKYNNIKNDKYIMNLNINDECFIDCVYLNEDFYKITVLYKNEIIDENNFNQEFFKENHFLNYVDRLILNIIMNHNKNVEVIFSNEFIKNLFIYYKIKKKNNNTLYLIYMNDFLLTFLECDKFKTTNNVMCLDLKLLDKELSVFTLYFQESIFNRQVVLEHYKEEYVHEMFLNYVEESNSLTEKRKTKLKEILELLYLKTI